MKKETVQVVSVIAAVAVTYVVFFAAMNNQEKAECIGWQEEAQTLPDYFITEWQKMQCDAHSIAINAPVR